MTCGRARKARKWWRRGLEKGVWWHHSCSLLIALVGQAYSKVLQPSSAMVEPKQPPSPKANLTVAGKLSFNVTKCAITIEKTIWKHVLSTNFPWTKMSSACFNQLQDQYHHESNDFWSHLSGSREFATTASTRDLQCHGGIPASFDEGEQKGRTHVMLWIDRLFKKVWRIWKSGKVWNGQNTLKDVVSSCWNIWFPLWMRCLFYFENLPWEIDHLQILHQTVIAGIPLSNEFSEVIEAAELWPENLKKLIRLIHEYIIKQRYDQLWWFCTGGFLFVVLIFVISSLRIVAFSPWNSRLSASEPQLRALNFDGQASQAGVSWKDSPMPFTMLSSYEKVVILSRWDSRWIWKLLLEMSHVRIHSNSHQTAINPGPLLRKPPGHVECLCRFGWLWSQKAQHFMHHLTRNRRFYGWCFWYW